MPIEQQITFHEEHHEVPSREVNDPRLAKDFDWKDQTVEVIETSEQPVVIRKSRMGVVILSGSDHVGTYAIRSAGCGWKLSESLTFCERPTQTGLRIDPLRGGDTHVYF